jgi:hypothetical protein
MNEAQHLDPETVKHLIANYRVMSEVARRAGMSIEALVARCEKQDGELGARSRLHRATMDVVARHQAGKKPQHDAKGGTVQNGTPWQQRAFANAHGQLHRELGIPVSQKIPEGKLKWAARQPGKLGARARAVLNSQGIKYAGGGDIVSPEQDDQHQFDYITSNGRRAAAVPENQRSPEDHAAIDDYQEMHGQAPDAAAADPDDDPRYNPSADATDPHGVVDGQPIMATPGEFMIRRAAAIDYSPGVKAALNDPKQAQQINDALEQLLGLEASGSQDDGESDDGSGGAGASDDAGGLGNMKSDGTAVAASTSNQPRPKDGGVPRPKSRLAQITRVE